MAGMLRNASEGDYGNIAGIEPSYCKYQRVATLTLGDVNMNEKLREAVVERDRGECQNCGAPVGETGDVHHIVPRGAGGATVISNLVLLCRTCHDAIHDDETTAPTVHFRSSGNMSSECFSGFLRFVKQLPSSQFVSELEMWRIPKANFDRFLNSIDDSDESDIEQIPDNQTTLGD